MKITILTPDFAGNSLARSYLLAKLLQTKHQVKVVGPMFHEHIWPPLMNVNDVVFYPIKMAPSILCLLQKANKIVQMCQGDVLYVSKPLASSFGPGLMAKFKHKIPLILDIDDWEMAPFLMQGSILRFGRGLRYVNNPLSFFPTLGLNQLIKMADLITVSSRGLKHMYGGTIIPHVRKAVRIDNLHAKNAKSETVILFLGTPRLYKGIHDLIEAFKLVKGENIVLRIIGIDNKNRDNRSIISSSRSDNRIQLQEMVPFGRLKSYIASADIIVIPQRDTPVGRTQVPAKIFDAMAQGKAIISTRISDIPEILGDSGIIVEPNNVTELKNAIDDLLRHPAKIKLLGKKAQRRCKMYYDFNTTSKKLNDLITSKFNV